MDLLVGGIFLYIVIVHSIPAPKIPDIGILASTDPIPIDKAATDLIKEKSECGRIFTTLKNVRRKYC